MAPPITEAAEGQVTWAVHVSLVPTWFDPAETSGISAHTALADRVLEVLDQFGQIEGVFAIWRKGLGWDGGG